MQFPFPRFFSVLRQTFPTSVEGAAAGCRADAPLASFSTEGDAYSIVIRGDRTSKAVEVAIQDAVQDAVKHLSRKLLN